MLPSRPIRREDPRAKQRSESVDPLAHPEILEIGRQHSLDILRVDRMRKRSPQGLGLERLAHGRVPAQAQLEDAVVSCRPQHLEHVLDPDPLLPLRQLPRRLRAVLLRKGLGFEVILHLACQDQYREAPERDGEVC